MKRLHQTILLKTCAPGGTKKKLENTLLTFAEKAPFREESKFVSAQDGEQAERIESSEEELYSEEETGDNEAIERRQDKEFEYASDNGLSPIEEETESCFSSEGTTGNRHLSEFDDYNTDETFEELNSSDKEELDEIGVGAKNQLEGIHHPHNEQDLDEHQEERELGIVGNNPAEAKKAKETLDGEASGDNDDTNAGPRTTKLQTTVETLKDKVADAEREIIALKKQLSLEKFRSREFVLQCHDKCMKANELLKADLQAWKDTIGERMRTNLAKSQIEERDRVNEEIARISELYSLEIAKGLKRSAREWRDEDAKRTFEMVKQENSQRISDSENMREEMKKIYDRTERHLGNVEKRNGKSHSNLEKRIDKWERYLKGEIVKSREDNWKKLRRQVKLWFDESNDSWHDDGAKRHRKEWQAEVQRTDRDAATRNALDVRVEGKNLYEEEFLRLLNAANCKNLRKMEQGLKTEMKAHYGNLAGRMESKIGKLWTAFEEFKHNFTLNAFYQSNKKDGCVVNRSNDSDSSASLSSYDELNVKGDPRPQTVNSATSTETDRTNKAFRRRDGNRVTFRKKSSVEMPIVPQIRDDRTKK